MLTKDSDSLAMDSRNTHLTLALVEQRLRGRSPVRIEPVPGLTRAAVLLLLRDALDGVEVLLTMRGHAVRDHKGEVSLPGGAMEVGDMDEFATALREAQEEVGLNPEMVRVLGRLDDYVTVTGYHVAPVVAAGAFDGLSPRTAEIVEVFPFPLAFMLDPAHVERIPGARFGRTDDILMVRFGARLVWGATARILFNLLEICT